MSSASRIFLCLFLFLAAMGSAFVLPRVAVGGDTGLAAGATAAVTFLGLLFVALVIAITALVMTLRNRATLSGGAKIAGFLPLPLLLVGAIIMVVLVRQKQEERRQSEPPPKTLTPTTVPTP